METKVENQIDFQTVFHHATIGIVMVLPDGTIEMANPCLSKIFGYEEDELNGKSVEILVPTDLRERHAVHRSNYLKAPSNKQIVTGLQLTGQRKSGEIFPLELSLAHYIDSHGIVTVAFVSDSTDKINAQKKILQAHERYRLLFEGIQEPFTVFEVVTNSSGVVADLRYVEVNPKAEEVLGRKRHELIGHLRSETQPPISEKGIAILKRILTSNEVVKSEHFERTEDRWYDVLSYSPEPNKVALLKVDITDRKRLIDELRTSENRTRLLIEHTPAAVSMLDTDLNYIIVSRRWQEVFDLVGHNVIGKNRWDVFPSMSPKWKEIFKYCLEGKTQSLEDVFIRKNGTEDWIKYDLCPWYNSEGSVAGIIIFSEIITQRKKAQDNLLKVNQQLEERVKERTHELTESLVREQALGRMKSSFVSTASHEFRTPLSVILSSIYLAERLSEAGKVSELQKQFGKIKSSVQTMVDMLNDFLSIDKLEQGKIAIEFEKVSILDFIDEQISELDAIKKQGQEIMYTHQGPVEIIVEKKILRTILLNLLSNAIKYSSREIELSTEVKDVLILTIKDHGIGIPADQFENVFEKFFRAKNTGAIQGVGLGLNIVKRYVELLNGKITFASREGEGSLFLVEIPIQRDHKEMLK